MSFGLSGLRCAHWLSTRQFRVQGRYPRPLPLSRRLLPTIPCVGLITYPLVVHTGGTFWSRSSRGVHSLNRSPFCRKQVIVSFSGQLTYSRIPRHSSTIMTIAR